jgi:phosphopantothenate synthetase
MRTTAAPGSGVVLGDRDRPRRALRVSAHPEAELVLLSVWDGDRCASTVRVDPADVPALLQALARAAMDAAGGQPRTRVVPAAS